MFAGAVRHEADALLNSSIVDVELTRYFTRNLQGWVDGQWRDTRVLPRRWWRLASTAVVAAAVLIAAGWGLHLMQVGQSLVDGDAAAENVKKLQKQQYEMSTKTAGLITDKSNLEGDVSKLKSSVATLQKPVKWVDLEDLVAVCHNPQVYKDNPKKPQLEHNDRVLFVGRLIFSDDLRYVDPPSVSLSKEVSSNIWLKVDLQTVMKRDDNQTWVCVTGTLVVIDDTKGSGGKVINAMLGPIECR